MNLDYTALKMQNRKERQKNAFEKYKNSFRYEHENLNYIRFLEEIDSFDVLLRRNIKDKEILNKLKSKKKLSDVLMLLDFDDYMLEIDKILTKNCSCVSEPCSQLVYQLKSMLIENKTKEEIASCINKTIDDLNFFKNCCCPCERMEYLLSVSPFLHDNTLLGCFISDILDLVFVKIDFFGFSKITTAFHEYFHYFSFCNADVSKKRTKVIRILSEGITDILSKYFLIEFVKLLEEKNISLQTDKTGERLLVTQEMLEEKSDIFRSLYTDRLEKGEICYIYPCSDKPRNVSVAEVNKSYYSYLKDLSTLKDISTDKINELSFNNEWLYNKTYLYNSLLVCKIMQDIGISKVIKDFLVFDFLHLEDMCKEYYGSVVWKKVNQILNFEKEVKTNNLNIDLSVFKEVMSVLKTDLK